MTFQPIRDTQLRNAMAVHNEAAKIVFLEDMDREGESGCLSEKAHNKERETEF